MRKWTHKSVIRLIEESNNSNPIDEIKHRARNLVLRALEMGWDGPPYSPLELAKMMNIDVIPNDSIPDARIIEIKKNHLQIQYNPYQKPTRVNFSISHEIAHTFFSDCSEEIRNRENDVKENKQLEQLCNMAAAEIQLPYAVFSSDANSVDLSMEGLISLATKYKASLESVFIRFAEVVDKPCCILIGLFQADSKIAVDYTLYSKYFPTKIPDSFTIPLKSNIYECISPGWTARETTEWNILNDQKYNIFSIGISPYKRDKRPRVGVLIVPEKHSHKNLNEDRIFLEYGDATKPRGTGTKIIAQVVNTGGAVGIGFGKALAKNYPVVKTELDVWHSDKEKFQLGKSNLIKINKDLYVFQMLAQKGLYPKGDEIPLKYNNLRDCLCELAEIATSLKATVHMPQIGAGQARGDWNIILGMIHDELIAKQVKVNIYLLPGRPYNPNMRSTLTAFKEDSTWETGKLF